MAAMLASSTVSPRHDPSSISSGEISRVRVEPMNISVSAAERPTFILRCCGRGSSM